MPLPTTRPDTVKFCGVFAQPSVDKDGRKLLRKWYDGGCRLFMGWASSSQTSGADPAKDRAEQLAWRAAVKALGTDAVYVDYVLPDWRMMATAEAVKLMLDDPQCLGFFFPEEPNLTPPADTTGKVWRVPLDWWKLYAASIDAADPNQTKLRIGDFAGNKLTAAWGAYTGDDAKPYAESITRLCTNWHPRNAYGDTRADCDAYPGRAVRMLGRISATKPRWYISECAYEKLNAVGRAPKPEEVIAQLAGVFAENAPNAPIEAWLWFPQKPAASAAHVFDNTTDAEFATVKMVNAFLSPVVNQPPPPVVPVTPTPDPITARLDAQDARIAALTARLDAMVQAGAASTQPSK
jgi:hypothetical protein